MTGGTPSWLRKPLYPQTAPTDFDQVPEIEQPWIFIQVCDRTNVFNACIVVDVRFHPLSRFCCNSIPNDGGFYFPPSLDNSQVLIANHTSSTWYPKACLSSAQHCPSNTTWGCSFSCMQVWPEILGISTLNPICGRYNPKEITSHNHY